MAGGAARPEGGRRRAAGAVRWRRPTGQVTIQGCSAHEALIIERRRNTIKLWKSKSREAPMEEWFSMTTSGRLRGNDWILGTRLSHQVTAHSGRDS